MSFVTGSLLLVGNIGSVATAAAVTATWVGTMVALQPDSPAGLSTGAVVGLSVAIAAAWALMNLQRITALAWCNVGFAAFELVIAVVICVTLYSLSAPTGGASMWSQWGNGSGFSGVDGYVVLLCLSNAMYTLSAYDVSGGGGGRSRVMLAVGKS